MDGIFLTGNQEFELTSSVCLKDHPRDRSLTTERIGVFSGPDMSPIVKGEQLRDTKTKMTKEKSKKVKDSYLNPGMLMILEWQNKPNLASEPE